MGVWIALVIALVVPAPPLLVVALALFDLVQGGIEHIPSPEYMLGGILCLRV